MANFQGHTIFEARNGDWVVGVLLANNQVATYSGTPSYANEATATLEAKRRHFERPHMNFAVIQKPR